MLIEPIEVLKKMCMDGKNIKKANSLAGYIALLRQLASFARLGRRSLDPFLLTLPKRFPPSVVGATVGTSVVGATVVGAIVVGAIVVGATVVGT